ncbi:MAG: MFS transporter [Nitrososphaerales archaeon]
MAIEEPKQKINRAIGAIAAGSFLQNLAVMAILLALPTIADDLNTSIFVIVWVIFGYSLMGQSLTVPMGKLGDIYGRKLIYVLGLTIAGSAAALSAISVDVYQLIGFRFLAGFGAAMSLGTSSAQIVAIAPDRTRGRSIGVLTSSVMIGVLLGPVIGGLIVTYTSWRALFGLIALIEIPLILSAILFIPKVKPSSETSRKFDKKGAFLFSSIISSLLLGFTTIGNPSIPVGFSYIMLTLSPVFIVLFVLAEKNKEAPLLDLKLFRILRYGGGIAVAFPAAMALHSLPFTMVFFLQSVRNISPTDTAIVLVFLTGVQLFGLAGGWLSDRIGSAIPMASGLSLYMIGFLTLYLRAPDASIPEFMLLMVIVGVGAVIFATPMTSMVLGALPKRSLGVGSGLLASLRFVGGLVAQAIVIAILGLVLGQAGEISSVLGGARILDQALGTQAIQYVFLASMTYSAVALSITLLLIKKGIGKKVSGSTEGKEG